MKPAARHKARIYALQSLYAWLLSNNHSQEIEEYFLINNDFTKVDTEYFVKLFRGVISNVDRLDQQMLPFLDRPLKELTLVELCILRIAIFELIECPDVPFRVVINEAVELNKKFGSTDGFKYINGVLDQVAKKLREQND